MLIGNTLPPLTAIISGAAAALYAPSHGDPTRAPQTFVKEMQIVAGSAARWPAKVANVFKTTRNYLDPRVLSERLTHLENAGILDPTKRPTRSQILAGGMIMLFGVINPDYNAFSRETGTSIAKKNFLRFLMQPASLMDPYGFFTADPQVVTEHLLQTDHRDARYDFDLYFMWPQGDGLIAELREAVIAVKEGRHPYSQELSATVETADYYDRLIQYIDNFLDHSKNPPAMTRQGVRIYVDRHGRNLTTTFSGLKGFTEYCAQLPSSPVELLRAMREELRGIRVVTGN